MNATRLPTLRLEVQNFGALLRTNCDSVLFLQLFKAYCALKPTGIALQIVTDL
jgi:hypothetical protein